MTLSLKDNIYDLKSAESIVNEQKALLQTILDAVPDFISLQDHEGRFISVNKAFCEMLDKGNGQILGKTNDDLFPENFFKYIIEKIKHFLKRGLLLLRRIK